MGRELSEKQQLDIYAEFEQEIRERNEIVEPVLSLNRHPKADHEFEDPTVQTAFEVFYYFRRKQIRAQMKFEQDITTYGSQTTEYHYECPKCTAFVTGSVGSALDVDLNVTCQSCDFEGEIQDCTELKFYKTEEPVVIDMSNQPPMTQEEIQSNFNRLVAKGRIDVPEEE